jgi:uncharacterized protein YjiS (DUF1127 family)
VRATPAGTAWLAIQAAELVARAIRAGRRAYLAWLSRRVIGKLLEKDDRLLKDIGVSRHELEQAMCGPWHQDPMDRLTCRGRTQGCRRH